jgi:hypothetical protein
VVAGGVTGATRDDTAEALTSGLKEAISSVSFSAVFEETAVSGGKRLPDASVWEEFVCGNPDGLPGWPGALAANTSGFAKAVGCLAPLANGTRTSSLPDPVAAGRITHQP